MKRKLIFLLLCILPTSILCAGLLYHCIQQYRFTRAEEEFYSIDLILTRCLREAVDSYIPCDSNRAIVRQCRYLLETGVFDRIYLLIEDQQKYLAVMQQACMPVDVPRLMQCTRRHLQLQRADDVVELPHLFEFMPKGTSDCCSIWSIRNGIYSVQKSVTRNGTLKSSIQPWKIATTA